MSDVQQFGPDTTQMVEFNSRQRTIAMKIAIHASEHLSYQKTPPFTVNINSLIRDYMYPDLVIINNILKGERTISKLNIEVTRDGENYYMTVKTV